jgi:hypothetical protein
VNFLLNNYYRRTGKEIGNELGRKRSSITHKIESLVKEKKLKLKWDDGMMDIKPMLLSEEEFAEETTLENEKFRKR